VTALVDLAVGPVAHHLYQVEDPRRVLTHNHNFKAVLWIRIRMIRMFLGPPGSASPGSRSFHRHQTL
jgi:hypothetical protein